MFLVSAMSLTLISLMNLRVMFTVSAEPDEPVKVGLPLHFVMIVKAFTSEILNDSLIVT